MTKEELRKIYKEKRKHISVQDNKRLTDLILINFQKADLPFANCVHTYLPIVNQNEVDTENIIRYLKFKNPGIRIVVPKINLKEGEMVHYNFNEDLEMAVNSFGILEPVKGEKIRADQIDLILAPLLAFDKCGNRVGYGKGFYDKFFPECNSNVIRLGLSFFEAEEMIDDITPFDIPLHYCITPHSVYKF